MNRADKKAYYEAHKEGIKARMKAYYEAHKEGIKARMKAYYQAHREEKKDYYESHREERKAKVKSYYQAHRDEKMAYMKAYMKSDTNSLGETKNSVRCRSRIYLFNTLRHTKVEGYEIHHCFGYEDYKNFIYIPKELHLQIHQFLRDNGIDADSNHYNQIEHIIVNYLKCKEKHVLILNNKEDNHA